MNRRAIIGAVYFPAFLFAWTAGVVAVVLQMQPAGAMLLHDTGLVRQALESRQAAPLAQVNTDLLADADAWGDAMQHLARHSRVVAGRWQPPDATPRAAVPVPELRVAVTVSAPAVKAPAEAAVAAAAEVRKTPSTGSHYLAMEKSAARRALESGRFAEAYARLRPRVTEARHDVEYLGLLAIAAMRTGSHGEAMVLYQRLTALQPDSGRWRTGLAMSQERLGLDAAGVFREALARSDGSGAIGAALREKLADHADGDVG
ncbi:MAG: tetratricopeptide repeat protein [Gammaproteobacteria bacterium]|nr:tetratricopeptide repeat protein [Gammaproteobacteria bacterium]